MSDSLGEQVGESLIRLLAPHATLGYSEMARELFMWDNDRPGWRLLTLGQILDAVLPPAEAAIEQARSFAATVEAQNAAALALHVLEDCPTAAGDYYSACKACGYVSDDMDANPCPTRRVLLGIEPW